MNTTAQNRMTPEVEPNSGAKLGQGNVDIPIGNKVYTLKPNLHAMQTLSRRYGGLMEATQKLSILDFDAIMETMYLGLGAEYAGNNRKRTKLAEEVYAHGLLDSEGNPGTAALCVKYVGILMRGGKPKLEDQDDADDSNDEGEPKNPQSSND